MHFGKEMAMAFSTQHTTTSMQYQQVVQQRQQVTTSPVQQSTTPSVNTSTTQQLNQAATSLDISEDEESALIKLLLAKLIEFLNRDEDNQALLDMLSQEAPSLNLSIPNSAPAFITSSDAGTVTQTLEWHTVNQALNFSISGEFQYDDKQINMTYTYSIESAYTFISYKAVHNPPLKDPIIVQFGDRPLGHITNYQTFDIDSDNNNDSLPIFTGDVGFLVHDKNGNRKADDGKELFGPKTGFGFNELDTLDEDQNGFIDKSDSAYKDLYIWQPGVNGSNGQFLSLKQADVAGISTQAITTPFSFLDNQGNTKAQMRYSSFAFSHDFKTRGVHQVDVEI